MYISCLWLTYFLTGSSCLFISFTCFSPSHTLTSFSHTIILHCLDGPQFIYPFTYWRKSWFFLSFSNCEWSCCKHPCVGFCVGVSFQILCVNTKVGSCWIIWTDLGFVRNHQTVFQDDCTILCSQQQWVKVPVAPHPDPHLVGCWCPGCCWYLGCWPF